MKYNHNELLDWIEHKFSHYFPNISAVIAFLSHALEKQAEKRTQDRFQHRVAKLASNAAPYVTYYVAGSLMPTSQKRMSSSS